MEFVVGWISPAVGLRSQGTELDGEVYRSSPTLRGSRASTAVHQPYKVQARLPRGRCLLKPRGKIAPSSMQGAADLTCAAIFSHLVSRFQSLAACIQNSSCAQICRADLGFVWFDYRLVQWVDGRASFRWVVDSEELSEWFGVMRGVSWQKMEFLRNLTMCKMLGSEFNSSWSFWTGHREVYSKKMRSSEGRLTIWAAVVEVETVFGILILREGLWGTKNCTAGGGVAAKIEHSLKQWWLLSYRSIVRW